MCGECDNEGFVFAYSKWVDAAPFVFRCNCSIGRGKGETSIPFWESTRSYVLERHGRLKGKAWVVEQIKSGDTDTEEFKKQMDLYGRGLFVSWWKELKDKDQALKVFPENIQNIKPEIKIL